MDINSNDMNNTVKADILSKMLEISPATKPKLRSSHGDKVVLNIGASRFETRMSQFSNIPGSRLHGLSILKKADVSYDKYKDEYYFDRNSALFPYILDLHR